MTTEVASRCCSLPGCVVPPSQRDHVESMTSSPPTTGHDDEAENGDTTSNAKQEQQQQQKEQRLSFGINQILQGDDRLRRPGRDHAVISGNGGVGDATASTMALIRSAFGSYVSGQGSIGGVPGLMVGGTAGAAGGLYGGTSGVIRVPAQRLSAGVCVGQPGSAAAACRLSAMMFPWMRERKDGLTCTYLHLYKLLEARIGYLIFCNYTPMVIFPIFLNY